MSEAKHTPGPWVLETLRTSCGICHKVGPFPGRHDNDEPRHACLYADYPSKHNPADAELEANARLIAAAPDLLEALIKYMDAIDMFDKASKDGINYHGAVGNRLATEEIARAAIAKATGKAQ